MNRYIRIKPLNVLRKVAKQNNMTVDDALDAVVDEWRFTQNASGNLDLKLKGRPIMSTKSGTCRNCANETECYATGQPTHEDFNGTTCSNWTPKEGKK